MSGEGPRSDTSTSHRPSAASWETELCCDKAAAPEQCHYSGTGARLCQALTQQPGGARPAAKSLPQLPRGSSMVGLAGFQLLAEGSGKGQLCSPTMQVMLASRTCTGAGIWHPLCCQAGTHSEPGQELGMLQSFGIVTLPAAGVARLAQPAGSTPPPTENQDTLQCPPPSPVGLTLREAWWVVVDISDYDGDCGGSRQATQLSCHVCCTDHHLVAVLCLTVQVCHGCPDHTWKPAGQLSTGRSQSHRRGEAGRGHRRSLWTRSRPKQDQLDLPLHMGQMLQYFTNLRGPSLDSLWYAHRITFGSQTQQLHLTSAQ